MHKSSMKYLIKIDTSWCSANPRASCGMRITSALCLFLYFPGRYIMTPTLLDDAITIIKKKAESKFKFSTSYRELILRKEFKTILRKTRKRRTYFYTRTNFRVWLRPRDVILSL